MTNLPDKNGANEGEKNDLLPQQGEAGPEKKSSDIGRTKDETRKGIDDLRLSEDDEITLRSKITSDDTDNVSSLELPEDDDLDISLEGDYEIVLGGSETARVESPEDRGLSLKEEPPDMESAGDSDENFLLTPSDEMFADEDEPTDANDHEETPPSLSPGEAPLSNPYPMMLTPVGHSEAPLHPGPPGSGGGGGPPVEPPEMPGFGGDGFMGWRKGVRFYREHRDHGTLTRAADNVTRFAGAGGLGWAVGAVSKYLFANSLHWSLPMRYGLVPGLGAGVAVAQLGARKAAEEIHYQRWVKTNFERIAGAAKTTAENEDQALRNVRKLIEKNTNKNSNKLLDTVAEQDVIDVFHKSGIAKLALVPFLRNEQQYAEFCFILFTELCKTAAENAAIAGLNTQEREALAKYHLTGITDAAEKAKIRKSLVEMCNVYGRLIAQYHRSKREAQLYGSILGASGSMAWQSGGFSLLIGGLALGARRWWVSRENDKLHIEIDEHGELKGKKKGKHRGPIIPPELSRGEYSLVDHSILHACEAMTKDGLSDEGKRWFDRIVIPEHLEEMDFHTAEEMAKEASPEVVSHLTTFKAFSKPASEDEIKLKFDAWRMCQDRLQKMEDKLDELPAQIQGIRYKAAGAKTPKQRKAYNDQADDLQSELDQLPARITRQQEKLIDIEKKYMEAKKGKEPEKNMTSKEIAAHEEIKRAFAVKVHLLFKKKHEHAHVSVLRKVGIFLKDKSIEKLKELGDVAASTAVNGGVSGVGAAILAKAFTSFNPTAAGVTVGVVSAIVTMLAKLKSTTVKIEKKNNQGNH